jgi:hypothetical protein
MEVFGGVFVLGRIAAPDVPATKAQTQVDPGVAHLETLFAAMGVGFHIANLIGVGTALHGRSP